MEYLISAELKENNYLITVEGDRKYLVPVKKVEELEEVGVTKEEAQEILVYLKDVLSTNISEQKMHKNVKRRKLDAINECFDYDLITDLVKKLMEKYPFDMVREYIEFIKPYDIVNFILVGELAKNQIIISQFEQRISSIVDYGEVVAESAYDLEDPVERNNR